MLAILINAYACGPNRGSEPGMAWNWCTHLAKYCELHIITEGEFRGDIEEVQPRLEQGKNMHFYYLPVDEKVRKMCWNQGDWRFYYYYKKWQKSAFKKAEEILSCTHIDVLHQLNMVGFREPGYLWKIKDVPLIWGPIGGMEQTPCKYLDGLPFIQKSKFVLKNIINDWQRKHDIRVKSTITSASYVIGATQESVDIVKNYHRKNNTIHINETGCDATMIETSRQEEDTFGIVWCGRIIYTKRIDIALKAICKVKDLHNIKLHIIGDGTEAEVSKAKNLIKDLKIEDLTIWHGRTPHKEVQSIMQKSNLFFFTSIKETTSTVILEAIQNRLPILCFDAFGFGPIVDSTVGIKIPLTNPEQSVKDFAEKIDYLYHHREKLQRMSEGCKAKQIALSWDSKAQQMVEIYKDAIASFDTSN